MFLCKPTVSLLLPRTTPPVWYIRTHDEICLTKDNQQTMNSRFYSPSPIDSATATLAGPEAHHLLHVLRAKLGDVVTLFDGSGQEFTARVAKLARAEVQLEIQSRAEVDRERPIPVIVATALPKGDRQKFLIEKCVELGVARLIPMQTEHSVAVPKEKSLDKLRRAVIEASKQCGRNRLMEISSGTHVRQLFAEDQPITPPAATRIVVDPRGKISFDQALAHHGAAESLVFAIGPEGGFAEEELNSARSSGWSIAQLGPRILRIETAAITCAAKLL